jgi:Chlorophyll A-B binding protein
VLSCVIAWARHQSRRPAHNVSDIRPAVQWRQALQYGKLKPPPKVSKRNQQLASIFSLMQFDGLAPELINGRAAMLGFAAALFMEIYTGESVYQQAWEEPRAVLVAFTLVLVASLLPLAKNVTPESEQHTIFQAKAEIWGGRAACVSTAAAG